MKHFVRFLCAGLVGLWGCQTGSDIIGIDSSNNAPLNVLLIDTLSVTASTVLSDTIPTSGSNVLLVGRSVNTASGTVQAQAYFQPIVNGSYTLNGDPLRIQYDSLVLELRYQKGTNGYKAAYGDTTRMQTISFFPLAARPDGNNPFYNNNQLPLAATPIATRQYFQRPGADTTVNLKLPNALGRQLFDLIKSGKLIDNDGLLELLPGFAVLPGATDDGAIVTFTSATRISLFYHDTDLGVNNYAFRFGVLPGNTQFNYIANDRRRTPLASLNVPRSDVVSSRLTNEETYIQFGAGLRTIYRIDGLSNLGFIPGFADVNRAELVIKPLRFSLTNNALPPPSLSLFPINVNNQITGALLDYTGQQVSASLRTDYTQVVLSYQYAFTLTNFVSNIAKGLAPNQGLILLPSGNLDIGRDLNRVALGSQNNPNKDYRLSFRVYYTTNR